MLRYINGPLGIVGKLVIISAKLIIEELQHHIHTHIV